MKKILVPVDGSEESKKAAAQAFELAKMYGAEITLMSVVEVEHDVTYTEIGVVVPLEYVNMRESLVTIKKESVGKMLDEMISSMACANVTFGKLVREGNAQHEIVEAANSGEFELIVMGHRGLNPVKRLLVGSVAKRVIEDAPCSVMIVKK